MLLKKADKLILKGFVGPYLVSFFIVEFVLIMQFMWKWIDDLLGRGYAMIDYLELIVYFGVTIIPMSLPLTVLLSSVMVYGDMAEHYELSSLKSAGLSLVRIFRPALLVAISTALLSITASNYFKPLASKAFLKKFNAMKLSKVTFALEEKIFNLDFHDHAIYADEIDEDGKNLKKVLIYYSHQSNREILNVITAQSAEMRISANGQFMVMDLFDGQQYQETPVVQRGVPNAKNQNKAMPMNTVSFKKYRKVFKLSNIFKDMSNINLERKKYDMLNSFQILNHVDSLDVQIFEKQTENLYSFSEMVWSPDLALKEEVVANNRKGPKEKEEKTLTPIKSLKYRSKILADKDRFIKDTTRLKVFESVIDSINGHNGPFESMADFIPAEASTIILDAAKVRGSSLLSRTWNNFVHSNSLENTKQSFLLRLHQQYCFALVCILLLFIGGPMGAIVRKGGFGYPMLVAIGFYMMFIILRILGEKLLISRAFNGMQAGWLPFFVLLPFAIIVTYMALTDRKLSFGFIKNLLPKRKEK